MTDYPDSEFQEAVQDEIAHRMMYDQITQAYFEDNETEFDDVDINARPLLKLVAFLLDDAILLSKKEGASINLIMDNMLQEEINILQRMQRLFE